MVFISYSSGDAKAAREICSLLESNGIRCWIAPRDITPGVNYAVEITQSIENSIAVITIISRASNISQHVANETDIAFNLGKEIIPYFIEDVDLSYSLYYYLGRKQWIAGYHDKAKGEMQLIETIKDVMTRSAQGNSPEVHIPIFYRNNTSNTDGVPTQRKSSGFKAVFRNKGCMISIIFCAALAIIAGFMKYLFSDFSDISTPDPVESAPPGNDDGAIPMQRNNSEQDLVKFCGTFHYSVPDADNDDTDCVYDLVLDPVKSKVTLIKENENINIVNSMGYCGTIMKRPRYWIVNSFNLINDGNEAEVGMNVETNNTCTVRLSLDDHGDIVMSYVHGDEAPGILRDHNGTYTRSVTFKRDN